MKRGGTVDLLVSLWPMLMMTVCAVGQDPQLIEFARYEVLVLKFRYHSPSLTILSLLAVSQSSLTDFSNSRIAILLQSKYIRCQGNYVYSTCIFVRNSDLTLSLLMGICVPPPKLIPNSDFIFF
jgi:hypothetical protein